jgi:GTPase Era involved in 16S rRNA processing
MTKSHMSDRTSTATTGRRTFPACASVTVEAGGQRVVLTGREGAMVAELALAAREIAMVEYGTITVEMTPGTCEVWVQRKRQKIHIVPPGE